MQSKLNSSSSFSTTAISSFETLKGDPASACLTSVKEDTPFVVECDAFKRTLAATLNQEGQPVEFHSPTFSPSEARYSTVKKGCSCNNRLGQKMEPPPTRT